MAVSREALEADEEDIMKACRGLADGTLKAKIYEWLHLDSQKTTYKEMRQLLTSPIDEKDLRIRFLAGLKFGTAGLRGPMGLGFSRVNLVTIQQTAQGLCRWLQGKFSPEELQARGVVIAYDHRKGSKNFAHVSAAVLLSASVRVHLLDRGVLPTPILSFAILPLKAVAGIMVTASHNPKTDNGYKVYCEAGHQIVPPMDKEIESCIELEKIHWPQVAPYWDKNNCLLAAHLWKAPLDHSPSPSSSPNNLLSDPSAAMIDLYMKTVTADLAVAAPLPSDGSWPGSPCCGGSASSASPFRFVYTAMHGVGFEFFSRLVECFGFDAKKQLVPVALQCQPDPSFPTVRFPNPEEAGAFDLAVEAADREGIKVIVANDPDADRLGAAEKHDGKWRNFSGDELGVIFADLLLSRRLGNKTCPPSTAPTPIAPTAATPIAPTAATATAGGCDSGAVATTVVSGSVKDLVFLASAVSSKMMKNIVEVRSCRGTSLPVCFCIKVNFKLKSLEMLCRGSRIVRLMRHAAPDEAAEKILPSSCGR
eukprot:GHVT01043067.1.p1 GENE.GHVT01043067.1~~GHVT01043067.1.p1  ORF type:complete len:535 (-),score=122.06 GHVT01043067.1:874-2478(-)